MRDDTVNIGTIRKLMGGRGSAKKYSRKGNEKKNYARQITLKILVQLPKKTLNKMGKFVRKKNSYAF